MKKLIWILFILTIALGVGLSIYEGPGILIIGIAGWRIDFPLWVGILILVLSYLLLHYTLKILSGIFNVSFYFKKMLNSYFKGKSKRFTQRGLIALTEGQNKTAMNLLLKGAKFSDMPWMNYLSAARAAQELGNNHDRDRCIYLATKALPEAKLAVGITQAELQFQQKEYAQALSTLTPLLEKSPNQPQLLKLLQAIYRQLKEWDKLLKILPRIKHYSVLSPKEMKKLEIEVWQSVLTSEALMSTFTSLEDLWQNIPKNLRLEGEIPLLYAKKLIRNNQNTQAEQLLRAAIKQEWNEDLVRLYGQLSHPSAQKLLTIAEEWLNTHPQSAELLLALGRLCEQQQLWGKAQRYFEASLTLSPRPETYAELGNLLERMNKPDLSAQFYKKGLLLATNPQKNQQFMVVKSSS